MTKAQLRTEYMAKRLALWSETASQFQQAIAKRTFDFIPMTASCVAGYKAVRGEVDVLPLLARLAVRGQALALPVVVARDVPLLFRSWKPEDPLEPGLYKIPEPLPTEEEVMPDVVLVPVVAFDRRGHRLGYGGGMYDRTLVALKAENPHILAIGVAYSCQEALQLPDEGHDMLLDMVVTEKEVIRTPELR